MPLAPAAPERGPRHVANALDTLTTALLPSLQEAARASVAPVSPATSLHARYLWAHDVLSAPLGELMADMDDADPALSRLSSLMAVVRGKDPGDAQARTALVLSVLPLRDVARKFTGPGADPHAAELLLVVMLQALFNMTHEQGRQLLPLVHAHGRELSLAQWVLAVQQPGRQHGALEMDTLAAVETRLNAMHPLAQMDEAEAEELLLRTVLPGWGRASRAALAQQWRDDRDGWSLADAAVRVRELTDNGRRRIEDALRTLHDERSAQRLPTAPAGTVAHALVGLLQAFYGPSAAAFADGVMARTGLSPAAPTLPVIQWPSALGTVAEATTPRGVVLQNLKEMHNGLRDKYEGIEFYGELMKRDPRATGAPASARAVAPPGLLTHSAERATASDPGFGAPGDLDSPGRLTDLGLPFDAPDAVMPAFLAGAAGGTLRRTEPTERIDAFTTLGLDDNPTPPASTAVPEPVPEDPAELTEAEVAHLRDLVPDWITQAPLKEQQTLQEWLDYQVTTGVLLDEEVASLESLHAFTQNRLAMALKHVLPDHTVDPADVVVTLTERSYPPADIPGAFFELPHFPQPKGGVEPITTETTMSLVDFALRNFGPGWTVPPELTLAAEGFDKGGRRYTLGADELIDLVRSLNAGERYKEYVNEQLITHTDVRDAWTANLHAGLQVALQTARMSGTVFPADFYLDPVTGQDFVSRMLDAVFAQPVAASRLNVDTHPVEITTLKIGFAADDSACQVNGLWLVRTADPRRGITHVAVIAPDAPDGKVVRVYASEEDARKDPYWRSTEGYAWLKSRMSLTDQEKLRVMTQRGDPVKSTGKDNMRLFTKNRMHFVPVRENFLERAYSDYVQTLLEDTDFLSTSTTQSSLEAIVGFTGRQLLLLADLPVPLLPSLRVLGRLGRGLSALGRTAPGSRTGTGSVASVVGKVDDTVNKSPDIKDWWKLGSDESLRVVVNPPEPPPIRLVHERLLGAPPTDSLSGLTQRMEELGLKRSLSIPEEAELRLLQKKLPEVKADLMRQHSHTIKENPAWQSLMKNIPSLSIISAADGEQYLAYLLSQQGGIAARITKMLESLVNKGVEGAPATFRELHRQALKLIGDAPLPVPVQGLSKVPGTKSLPPQGAAGTGASGHQSLPAQGTVLKSPFKTPGMPNEDGKRVSDGVSGASPTKKYAWSSPEGTPQSSPVKMGSGGSPWGSPGKKGPSGLTLEGQLPPRSDYPYVEVPRNEWPAILNHYTDAKGYHALMAAKFDFLNPSNVNPMGMVGKGAVPRIVYVTDVNPQEGRKRIAELIFGRSQFQQDRTAKVAFVLPLETRNLPTGTRIARFTDKNHQSVWTIGVPGDGSIRLRDANGSKAVWKKPAPGNEKVPG